MEKIRQFLDGIKVLLARFYNSMHPKLKIALMVLISFVVSGFVNLFIRDLTDLNGTITNDYLKLIVDGFIPFLTVVFNLVQQWGVEQGTKILAAQGDPKTIVKLEDSIAEKQELVAQSK